MSLLLQSHLNEELVWQIKLLGGLAVLGPKRKITRFRTRKAAALLAYLAVRLTPQPREVLIEIFWPEADPDAGRHNLSNALSSLRLVLEPAGVTPGSVIEADRFNVGLNPRSVSTDALDFEETIHPLLSDKSPNSELIHGLEQALSLYQGPLLPGFYEDWVTPESVRLDSLYKQAQVRLTDLLLAAGEFEKAVHWAQLGLKNDPLEESSILVLMTALEKLGRHSDAIRAYRRFCEVSEREALASPSTNLQNLALQIEARAHVVKLDFPQQDPLSGVNPSHAAQGAMPAGNSTASGHSDGDFKVRADGEEKPRLLGDEFLLRTMTRFFGRREEMARLAKMLALPRTRLVTITGPGGIGKTRFALEAIADIANGEYGDRGPFAATFVNLADVSDPQKIFGKILSAVSGVVHEFETPRDAVVRMLDFHPKPLLVLDNFEQLVEEGTGLIRSLLAGSPRLQIVITSRQRLRLDGEQVFALASLAMPKDSISLSELSQYPSVDLFIDRAEAASVDFHVTDQNLAVVCRLCATLEGVPLAIELAAARVSLMSTAHILAEVEKNRLDFLMADYQDVVPRQQTIRATIAWSFRLLKEDAKGLLCALSHFRGGWTMEAAQAISGLDTCPLASMLTDLRDVSLITVSDDEQGMRFSMSEVIREFASEECLSRGELDKIARMHANYFVEFAEESIHGFLTPEGLHVLRRFTAEQANLLAAKTWADAHGNDPLSRKLGMTLIRFWLSVNWDQNARRVGKNGTAGIPQSTLGLLIPLGGPMEPSADPDEVSDYLQQLAEMFEERGTTEPSGWILVQLGYTNLGRDLRFARKVAERGVALLRQAENATALAHALNALAVITGIQGEYEKARSLNQESYVLLGGDRQSKTYDFAIHTEGIIAFMAGDHLRGEDCLKQNLAYARRTSDSRSEFAALYVLGRVYNELGRFSESLEILEKASEIFSKGHGEITYLSGYLSCYLGYAHYKLGHFDQAISFLKESLFLFRESKRTQGFSMTLFFLAEILCHQKQPTLSAQLYGASEMFRHKHGRALDRRETEWDSDLRDDLRKELASAYEEQVDLGLALSENEAILLATRALDACVPAF